MSILDTIKAELEHAVGVVENSKTVITDLKTTVASHEQTIATQAATIAAHEQTISTITSDLQGFVSSVKTKFDDFESFLNNDIVKPVEAVFVPEAAPVEVSNTEVVVAPSEPEAPVAANSTITPDNFDSLFHNIVTSVASTTHEAEQAVENITIGPLQA